MRTSFLTIVFVSYCILFLGSCEKEPKQEAVDEKAINACGVIRLLNIYSLMKKENAAE